MTEKPANTHAFQHNHLIRTPLRMGQLEARLFIYSLAQVHQTDSELPPIRIPLTAIVGEAPSGKDYLNVKKACLDLAAQHVNVLPVGAKKGNVRIINLVSDIELDLGTGFITGSFNPKVQPYLLQLTKSGNFTSANIEKLLTFTNPNSARLYWILLSYRNLEGKAANMKKQIELDELKNWLLNDDSLYPVYADFKKRVLDPVAEDFKRIGFAATWQPVRTGKKTTALAFSIPRDRLEPKALRAAADAGEAAATFDTWLKETKDRKLQTAYAKLTEFNQLTAASARKIIRWVAEHPEHHASFYTTRHRIATHKEPIANMRSFTLAALNAKLGTSFK